MDHLPIPGLQPHNPTLARTESLSSSSAPPPPPNNKKKSRRGGDPSLQKRRCVSTACIACRRRKSKCDAALPSCAACASVYNTECVYDPNSDHRRKGVYREKIDSMKASNSTLQILIEAILNSEEEDVYDIVKRIRTCDNLDTVAESILNQEFTSGAAADEDQLQDDAGTGIVLEGERDLARKMGELRVENGTTRFIGGTSHLIHWDVLGSPSIERQLADAGGVDDDPITSWSNVTKDAKVVTHLLNMYFCWHYPYFTTLSRSLFYRDFFRGKRHVTSHKTAYCSALLVNAMLALGCHFTNVTSAYAVVGDSWSKGDHFFGEAKRLIIDNDEYEKPRLTTVQALALMSVREAGCGREAKGWVYSGMSFRMAQDLGLNMNLGGINGQLENLEEKEIDARRVTFWGCFLFDKCWSNYMGRLPQLPKNSYNVPKYDVFPDEDAEAWCPYTDSGFDESCRQASRTRTIGLQMSTLCEISSDLLLFFYHPAHIARSSGKSVELKKLSELHRRLEEWHKQLPAELQPKDGQLPNVILMHMFFHLQYIHLFRPFLRYAPKASPLPPHVSPRRICTANAGAISKLMRLYKKTYNLHQICNIAVYMLHSACTIHLLNLPEKTARRDIIHGVKHLEEIAEDWLCGRRALSIVSVLARKWKVDLPEEAAQVLQRTDERWGTFNASDVPSPRSNVVITTPSSAKTTPSPQQGHEPQSPTRRPSHVPTSPRIPSPSVLYDNVSSEALGGGSSSRSSRSSMAPRPTYQPHLQPQMQPQLGTPMVDGTNSIGTSNASPNPESDAMPINYSALSPADWPSPPPPNDVMPNYPRQYIPFTTGGQEPSQGVPGGQGSMQAAMPSSMFAVDGQDWYLKDGVNWQAGFNAWNMVSSNGMPQQPPIGGPIPEQQPLFVFGTGVSHPQRQVQQHAPTYPSTSNPGHIPTVPEPNLDSLHALSSMEGWDLSNLE
ncbi:fungal-specific transcription factor domain-containing protein [Poronia punctata]|nr:fungal-specific transcription factor domain-containing protein [Poronia punctata]